MKKSLLILVSLLTVLSFSTSTFAKSVSSTKQSTQQHQQSTVNLNKANAKEIAKILKGIGLKKAQSIIAYREKNGSFKAVEEVASVKGIGVKTIAKNYKRIVLK
jgi:competence protein ComEA